MTEISSPRHRYSLGCKQDTEFPVSTIAFLSHGLRIGIEFHNVTHRADATDIFPPGATRIEPSRLDRVYRVISFDDTPGPNEETGIHILSDDALPTHPVGYSTLDIALIQLEDQIEHYVAEFSVEHLFVHAGVVGWRNQAIIIPGRTHSGKSTLVHGLVSAGATYYSDEFAVLDRSGWVHPYQRRLSLRDGPYGAAGRIPMTGSQASPPPPIPVALVALLQFDSEKEWGVEAVTNAYAIRAICDHTLAIRRRPADTFAFLGEVIDDATTIVGTRGEAEDTIPRLLAMIGPGVQ